MPHLMSGAAAVLATALLIGASPAGAEPTTPRPPGGNLGTCYVAPNSDFGCEGAICWCCHTDGCFVCDQDFGACEWEPAYRVEAGRLPSFNGALQQLNPNQTFQAQPFAGTRR